MARYAAPSTRGQWQSNAYDILRPRCQNFMRERGDAPLPSPVRQPPNPETPKYNLSNTYSVHSPQVTGSPFKLIDRRLEGIEYIDPRAVLSPRRYDRASVACRHVWRAVSQMRASRARGIISGLTHNDLYWYTIYYLHRDATLD